MPISKKAPERFLLLLISLLLMILIFPLVAGKVLGLALANIFLTAILLSALYSIGARPRQLKGALLLGTPVLIAMWLAQWRGSPSALIVARVLLIAFLVLAVVKILRHTLSNDPVRAEKIYAALCGYLLIGLIWAIAFSVIELAQPGSLQFGSPLGSDAILDITQRCVYFSYATLTTLGYGDVTASSALGRSLAVLEAITGQLFLAVLVARLVGLHIIYSEPP